jgi:Flp pilus assembly protein TadB
MLSLSCGVWMSRRMARYWPSAAQLSGTERERVVRAARNGHVVDDAQLAPALAEYRDGLHTAAEDARPLRWLIWLVLIVAVASAVWDATFGSWGNAIASGVYLMLLALEVFWWPKRQRQLLANADHAVEISRDREPDGERGVQP